MSEYLCEPHWILKPFAMLHIINYLSLPVNYVHDWRRREMNPNKPSKPKQGSLEVVAL